ncbi:MAG: DNA (cytosine-5-)-methyltransferase [Kiritimatiellaceae bacterium]|nr:DNA (cytosine-5-)-methyltransferase [Kiritimatiellaceae bacterium]
MKYTEVEEVLITPKSNWKDDSLAFVTHYLQNHKDVAADCFHDPATAYLTKNSDFQEWFPIKWDVPFPPPRDAKFKFIDLFAGIGGFRIALQSVGGKCVFSSEWNDSAKKTYAKNFGEVPFGDIRQFTGATVSDAQLDKLIPDHDILAGGFPCQPFSLAGVSSRNSLGLKHGFACKTQGTLFFDIVRIAKVKKPTVLLLENVSNLKRHNGGDTYATIRKTIEEDLGYSFFDAVIDARTVVPQKRRRCFMVCFRDKAVDFKFPSFSGEPKPLKSILEPKCLAKYTISDRLWDGHVRRTQRNLDRGTGFTAFEANLDEPANTLVSRYGKDGKECLVPQSGKNPRKLTPRECARLQGFPEKYILPDSDAAAYRQFGNALPVPVAQRIARQIVKTLEL